MKGTLGTRIFKLEYKNAGFYEDLDDNGISTDFVNYQVWMYENSDNIELHFGSNSVSQPSLFYYTGVGSGHSLSSILNLMNGNYNTKSIYLTGNAANPTAIADTGFTFVNGTPPNGTIYRFIKGGTVSIDELVNSTIQLNVYPNPAIDFINLEINKNDLISPFVNIYDLNGKLVVSPSYSNQITVSELKNGTYFIEALTKDGKAVGKFIKK